MILCLLPTRNAHGVKVQDLCKAALSLAAERAVCQALLPPQLIDSYIMPLLLPCSCATLFCPAVYIFISQRLFHLTNELKDRIVPHDDNPKLARNILQGALATTAVVGMGWLIQRMVVLQLLL